MTNTCKVCNKTFHAHKKQNCCSRECSRTLLAEKEKSAFINKFNDLYRGRYEYVGGYQGANYNVNIRCPVCGNTRAVTAQCVKVGHRLIDCTACNAENRRAQHKERIEQQRQVNKEIRAKNRIVREQAKAHARQIGLVNSKANKSVVNVCEACGKQFNTTRPMAKCCSLACNNKRINRRKEISRRHAIRANGKVDWNISLNRLALADGMKCHICGCLVDMGLDSNDNMYGSIDHVIPISKGGTHTWSNVKLAHRLCNSIKNDTFDIDCFQCATNE